MGIFSKNKHLPHDCTPALEKVVKESSKKVADIGAKVYLTHCDGMRVGYIVISKNFKIKGPDLDPHKYESWAITYTLRWFRNPAVGTITKDESKIEKE